LLVGEAPGSVEDSEGEPFVGPAGILLDVILEGAGVIGEAATREPVLVRHCITNLVACFPKEAKESGKNEPPAKCIKACRPRLQSMMDIANPKVIVWVGKLAAKHGPLAVGDRDVLMAEIVHPAFMLRKDYEERKWEMKRAIAIMRGVL